MSTQTLTFDNYVLYEFYISLQKKLDHSDFDESIKSLFHSFIEKMINFSDAMAPIEELSTYPATSELTIMFMDLFEFASEQEADIVLPTLEEKGDSFLELAGLLIDEDGFLASIQNYVNGTGQAEEPPSPLDLFEEIDEAPHSEPEPVISEYSQDVHDEDPDQKVNYFEAIKSETLSRLSDLNPTQSTFLTYIFDQLDEKEAILNALLPSEVTNSVLIASDIVFSVGKDFYSNCDLLKQNIQSIEDEFINELKENNFNILKTVNESTKEAVEAIPQIKKPNKKEAQNSPVKEKVRKYFQNEVLANIDDVQSIIESVKIHEIIHEQFTRLKSVFTELKNISIIHGYEGIQTVSAEFSSFLNECIDGNFVFTEESQNSLQACVNSFRDIVNSADLPDEKSYIQTFFTHLNTFNETLAIIEIVEEECYSLQSSEVRNSFFKIVQGKYGLLENVSHKVLKSAIQDYSIYSIESNINLYKYLLSKPEKTIGEVSSSIIDSFLYEVSESDIAAIKSEIAKHTQKKILSQSPEEKHAQIKEERYTFDEFKDRNGIFESVFLKKLEKLSSYFKSLNTSKIIHLSNWIELESRLMGYEQVADLFNYFTINFDKIKPKTNDLLLEFEKVKHSPTNYIFDVDAFEAHEHHDEIDVVEKPEKAIDLDEIDDDIREIFSDEAQSYISELEDQLRTLKSLPDNAEALFKSENAAHTLHGAAKILQLDQIAALSGHIEIIFEKSAGNIDPHQIVEIENRLDTIKKHVGIFKPNSDSESGDLLDSGQDDEMMDIFRDESETELKHIEELFDQLIVAKDQASLLTSIESNSHTLKSSAKILGFKEIGLLAEKIEESGERLKNLNIHIGISIIDEMRNVLEIIKKLRNGVKVGINDVQNATQRLNESINGQMPSAKSNNRELGEFEQLFIDETLDKVLRISEKMEHSDPLEDISIEFNNIKRSAALVGFNRIKNLATVSEQLCDISSDKEATYKICQDIINEVKNACERILSGNYENIGQIDELISRINMSIKETEKEAQIDLSKEVESFRNLLLSTAEKIENRTTFMVKINRLNETLKVLNDADAIQSAVNDLLFITDRLTLEIESNIMASNEYSEEVKRQFFQFGDHGEILTFNVGTENYAIDHTFVSTMLEVEITKDTKSTEVDDKTYDHIFTHGLTGHVNLPQRAEKKKLPALLLNNDKLIVSAKTSFHLSEAQISQIGQLNSIQNIALTTNNSLFFIINPTT